MVESPLQTASGPTPPTRSGATLETIKTANGPPKMMVTVAVKNIINAFGPSPITAFRSILKVSKTREAGRRYLDATK